MIERSNLEAALEYVRWGWAVIPVLPNAKTPATLHGVKDATTDPGRVREWWGRNPDFNIGIAAGEKSGIIVFDIDPRNGGDQSWMEWLESNGAEPVLQSDCMMQLTAGGGQHYIAEYTPEIKSCKLAQGIDLLSDGKYFLAYPSTIDGRTYDWEADSDPFAGCPPMIIPPRWIEAAQTKTRVINENVRSGDPFIQGGRDDGLIALGGAMRGWGMSEAEILAALIVTNETRCIPPLTDSDIRRIARSAATFQPNEQLAAEVAAGHIGDMGQSEQKAWYLTRASSFFGEPAPIAWRVKKWIPQLSTGVLFGQSGAGKSFVAVDLACSIATGKEWANCKTKPGAVVYLAGEGNYGLRQRVIAWATYHNFNAFELDNLFISNAPHSIDGPESAAEIIRLVREVTEQDVALLIVDTLNKHMLGKENDAGDIGKILSNVSIAQAALGCSTLIVHHSGHGESAQGRERGSSALRAGVDFSIETTKSDNKIKIECKKQKDAPEPDLIYFELAQVDLGWTDEDGEPIQPAAVAVLADAPVVEPEKTTGKDKAPKISENTRRGIDSFISACVSKGRMDESGQFNGVSDLFWRDEFYGLFSDDIQPATKRQSFLRAKKNLVDLEYVFEADGYYYPTIESGYGIIIQKECQANG